MNEHPVIAQFTRQMTELTERRLALIDMDLPNLHEQFPQGKWDALSYIGYPGFSLPYSFDLIAQFKKYVAEDLDGWEITQDLSKITSNGRSYLYMSREDLSLQVNFSTDHKEATCVLNVIQEPITETIQEGVYEVICQEGAKEDTFGKDEEVSMDDDD